MANFRSNHHKGSGNNSGMTTKVGIFIGIVYLLYQGFNLFMGNSEGTLLPQTTETQAVDLDLLLPKGKNNQVVKHNYYSFNYNEKYEVVDWVVHEIDINRLNGNRVSRTDDFRMDYAVETGSARREDYKRSGYDRGHLVPAGDMNFDIKAMSETFFMSNMTPQVHSFNTGIWRELEESIRDWGKECKHLYVATGPVLTKEPIDYIGDNNVAVPHSFYKVIVDLTEPELKAIGFIIPNKVSYQPLTVYSTSVDEVEMVTGIDFFPDLLEDDLEKELEANYNMDDWTVSKRRFELRKKQWNKARN